MFSNYFKVAFRNILKQKFYSAINIIGLSIGIASCILIVLYVNFELGYDKFHADAESIYRVDLHGKIAGQEINTASSCAPLASTMEREIPEVAMATRLQQDGGYIMRFGDKVFNEDEIFYADSNFFQFFSFQLLKGDAKTVLVEPRSIVLTEEMAKKYFGDLEPVGQMLELDEPYKVTGVAANPPYNSHFRFEFLISASTRESMNSGIWLNNNLYTYFKLKPNTTTDNFEAHFNGFVDKYVGPNIQSFLGISFETMKEQGGEYGYYLTKLTDIHLNSISRDQIEASGEMSYMYIFMAIAGFIILIACINFMNLSTAKSANRAKEVGLRKTLGSFRSHLIFQFLTESLIFAIVATLLAFLIVWQALPGFNYIAGKQLTADLLLTPGFLGIALGIIVFVGVLAGSYPAFYLTSFNVSEVLKGKVRDGMKGGAIRSTLVVLQFSISIFLIICTGIIYNQLQYFQNRNMGIDKHNVLIVNNTDLLETNRVSFRESLKGESNITSASYTTNVIPGVNNTTLFRKPGSDSDHIMGRYYADYNHKEALAFEMASGRYFSEGFPSDSTAAVINEAAAKEFGWENPVGEEFITFDDDGEHRVKVVGVIKDFNFESLRTDIRPLIIQLGDQANQMVVRYQGDAQDAIATAEKNWKKIAPNQPFDFEFLDQEYDSLFRAEQRMGYIFTVFTGLAIFIACLGLVGLSAFTAEKRTKEIGVRKVMGASNTSVLMMLNKEFTRLVIISFVLAAPLSWWMMTRWLSDFSYRVSIGPWVFILAGVSTIVIAWLTVSWQSYKAAMVNPVISLKSE